MKTIYSILLGGLLYTQAANAQLTMEKQWHEPVANDVEGYREYDTSGVVPKATGQNQNWNFITMSMSTVAPSTDTYVTASSVPASSLFSGANLAANYGNGFYVFCKSATTPTTQLEMLGMYTQGYVQSYTNSMVQFVWPTAFGSSYSDVFSGSLSVSSGTFSTSGNVNGTISTVASGSGTVTLPGGAIFNGVLQIKQSMTTETSFSTPIPTTQVNKSITYLYFHSTQKFPLITISYDLAPPVYPYVTINQNVAQGLTDYNFDATFAIFPNPAKENFKVKLTNEKNESCLMEIYDATGQRVKILNLGKSFSINEEVSIRDLSPGVYVVKTSLGTKTSARRLLVE